MHPDQLPTITAVIERAYERMPAEDWDHLAGGAGSEVTLRRNRLAFDRIALRPRLLCDGGGRHTRMSFLGSPLGLPVMVAPLGSVARYHPEGAVACARAAHRSGTVAFISCLALPSLEDVRAATTGPLIAQIYLRGTRDEAVREIRRAEALGCLGVCLTADVAARTASDRRRLHPQHAADGGGRPRNPPHHPALHDLFDHGELLSWGDVEALRQETRLPLILKGVMGGEDARIGLDCGVDVIYVSNHGGRLADHLPSTMEVLQEIVAAVDGRAQVIVDGGFIRGSDVVKAIALGVSAVLIGKLAAWALVAGGEEGLRRVLDILQREISDVMAQVGARSIPAIGAGTVVPTFAPPASDWAGFAQAEHASAAPRAK